MEYQNYGDEEQVVSPPSTTTTTTTTTTNNHTVQNISNNNSNNSNSNKPNNRGRWFHRSHRGRSRSGSNIDSTASNDGLLGQYSRDDGNGSVNNGSFNSNNDDNSAVTEVYIVKQRHGYASYIFSIVQTIILIIMMVQCGIAPININPMIGPYPHVLSEWGGKNTVLMLEDGEWYRLITPIFLHAGVIHLLGNVFVQIETGAFFEREWGTFTWLVIYIVSAVGSTAFSVIFMPDAISVGSSGAVMGLFGGKAAEVVARCCESSKNIHDRIGHQVRKEQCAGVMCSVTVVMLFSFIPYVDWAAHLGGLIGGFCIGMVMFAIDLKKAKKSKLTFLFVGIGITAAYFIVLFHKMFSQDVEAAEQLRDVCGYYQQYFQDYECNCQRQNEK